MRKQSVIYKWLTWHFLHPIKKLKYSLFSTATAQKKTLRELSLMDRVYQ